MKVLLSWLIASPDNFGGKVSLQVEELGFVEGKESVAALALPHFSQSRRREASSRTLSGPDDGIGESANSSSKALSILSLVGAMQANNSMFKPYKHEMYSSGTLQLVASAIRSGAPVGRAITTKATENSGRLRR